MTVRLVGFIGPSYQMNSRNVDCQRCINLYPEINELGTGKEKEVASLRGTPGLGLFSALGSGPIRGIHFTNDGSKKLYVVRGNTLYHVSSSGTSTSIGTISTNSGPVSMANNNNHMVLVDGTTNGYTVQISNNSFAQITDPDFVGADQVTYMDGYFIFNEPNSDRFYISDLDGITFPPETENADSLPDLLVGLISDHRDLWLFGTDTTEVWFNSGNADFPFERVQGAVLEHGCVAPFSIAKSTNSVFWIGKDKDGVGIVYTAQGYQPRRISTHAVEQEIQRYTTLEDARGFTYQEDGHYFYVLNFPTADTTWVYDITTGLWHERAYNNNGRLERHRADVHIYAYGKHLVGDYTNGNIYEMSSSFYTDNGEEIIRRRRAPHITSELKRIFHHKFQLDIETGVGLDGSGQGTDPKIMLRFSDDGGHTWSNEKWVSLGKIGQRYARAIWRRLGASRDRVYEVSCSEPVKQTWIGADIDVEVGAA